MAALKHTLSPSASIESELLKLLARQGWMGPVPTLASLGVIAFFASSHMSPWIWGGWLCLCAFVLFGRSAILIKLPTLTQYPESVRMRAAISLSIVNGIVHGLSLVAFPYLTDLERAVQTMILTGIGSISVVTTAGFLPISLAYLIPTLLPTVGLWTFYTLDDSSNFIGFAVAVMVFWSSAIMVVLSRDTYGLFEESFAIRQRQTDMNEKLKGALQEAESASRAKTRFLASASHDLRQPIHALSLFGGALTKRPLDEQSREIAGHMDIALQSLASRLDSLLDISKLDAGIVQATKAPFNLRLMVERLQDEFMPAAINKGLKVWLDCAADAFVNTDEILLERIVRNLLANAIKYTERGRIELCVEHKYNKVVLTIKDSGRGIPLEEQDHVFEEFYQLHNPERDHTKGLGLGLAIVKRLADLLELDLSMDSMIGSGTVFTMCLPASSVMPQTQRPTVNNLSWDSLCALVIDDEHEVGLGMKALLESMGCKVLLAEGTLDALSQAKAERPDIVLADFRLRGEDNGILTIRTIRELYRNIPAILISGDTAPERLREAEDASIPLLHKPVLVDDLEAAIAEACELEALLEPR
ncbi:hybrid sensor histidine kinase/response regulator [Aestuariicella hydrocarbonica]|uniref:histidine kinase n=1 Tax=Pseudomaricurvus hydrocarbonicus TaxID=1470433 RepID=A0A9E5MLX1_9GAMM|nr:hybrid sensor histidine kinase/response regulator [Aestuariicella hydrocarbonica]NHO64880.1 hybrid sensor histidine kinase/response regulator [Aestuariicella hydrocarbonica]